jgi:hypothetical protein
MVRASMLVGYVMDSAIKRLVAGGALMSGCRDLLAKCFAVALIMCAIGSIRYLEIDSAGAAEPQVGLILSRAEQASLAGSAGSEALESDGWGFETYVGYGDLLSISTEASWENEASGLFELAGWSAYSDVVAISCREDLGEERMTRLPSEPDGWFSGTVWFVDGPGRYSLSVATRPPGKSSYIVVCSFCVRNVSCDLPESVARKAGPKLPCTLAPCIGMSFGFLTVRMIFHSNRLPRGATKSLGSLSMISLDTGTKSAVSSALVTSKATSALAVICTADEPAFPDPDTGFAPCIVA